MKIEGSAKVDFLLELTAALGAAIEGREGSVAPDEIKAAIETLWAPSLSNGGPFIAWLDLKLPFGRIPVFTARGNPLAWLAFPWRIVTLIAAAQLLDLAQARRWFGPPPPYLEREFANRKPLLAQPPEADNPGQIQEIVSKPKLRSDVEYQRLARQIMASPDWKAISDSSGSSRNRKLGRHMKQALKSERDRGDVP